MRVWLSLENSSSGYSRRGGSGRAHSLAVGGELTDGWMGVRGGMSLLLTQRAPQDGR